MSNNNTSKNSENVHKPMSNNDSQTILPTSALEEITESSNGFVIVEVIR